MDDRELDALLDTRAVPVTPDGLEGRIMAAVKNAPQKIVSGSGNGKGLWIFIQRGVMAAAFIGLLVVSLATLPDILPTPERTGQGALVSASIGTAMHEDQTVPTEVEARYAAMEDYWYDYGG